MKLRRPHPAQNHPIPKMGIRPRPALLATTLATSHFLIANSAIRNPSQVAENKRDTEILIANFCPRSAARLEDFKKNALIATPAIRSSTKPSGINHLDFSNRHRTASRPLIEPRTSNLELLIPANPKKKNHLFFLTATGKLTSRRTLREPKGGKTDAQRLSTAGCRTSRPAT